jgi:RNA polymerase sigma-70 factor (ECF subfamily)
MSVARNRATDSMRRRALGATKLKEIALSTRDEGPSATKREEVDDAAVSAVADDRLRLIFTCCHPALPL